MEGGGGSGVVPRGFQSRTTVIAGWLKAQLLPPPSFVLIEDSRGRALGKSAQAVSKECRARRETGVRWIFLTQAKLPGSRLSPLLF